MVCKLSHFRVAGEYEFANSHPSGGGNKTALTKRKCLDRGCGSR